MAFGCDLEGRAPGGTTYPRMRSTEAILYGSNMFDDNFKVRVFCLYAIMIGNETWTGWMNRVLDVHVLHAVCILPTLCVKKVILDSTANYNAYIWALI